MHFEDIKLWSSVEPTQYNTFTLHNTIATATSEDEPVIADAANLNNPESGATSLSAPDSDNKSDIASREEARKAKMLEAIGNDESPQNNNNLSQWQKDKRYGQMWKTPDDIYKSYSELEKNLPKWKKLESEATKWQQKEQEYSNYRAATEEKLSQYSQVDSLMRLVESKPEYLQKVQSAFKEIEQDIKRQKYGENIPEPLIARIQELESQALKAQELEAKMSEQEQIKEMSSQLREIDKFCEEHKLDYNKEEFVNYCRQNDVPPKFWDSMFHKFASKTIMESARNDGKNEVTAGLKKVKEASFNSSSPKKAAPIAFNKGQEQNQNLREKMLMALTNGG